MKPKSDFHIAGQPMESHPEYSKYSDGIKNTIRSMFVCNGIPLDPTYTGKGFYGMLEYLKKNEIKNVNVLFIHTGGTPLFFDNIHLLQ